MASNKNLREVLEPLGKRLYEYESGQYLANNPFGEEMESEYSFDTSFDYLNMMDEIGKAVNVYDPYEVYKEAVYYAGRIEKVIKNLQRKTHKSVWEKGETVEIGGEIYPHVRQIKLNAKEQDILYKEWKEELTYCFSTLREIIEARSHTNSIPNLSSESKTEIIQINLPQNFTIKQIQKHYTPFLLPIQGAQLLQYLKDLQVIPPYGPTDIGRLGRLLFGMHDKSITNGLLSIDNLKMKKEDLKRLQALLKSIDKEIEKDLKFTKD